MSVTTGASRCGMPSYTESSSIFGSIMIMPHMFGRRLVEQAKHHGIDADRFARAGRAGDQQVRHARQIRHDGHAADVLAQRQRQRRAISS